MTTMAEAWVVTGGDRLAPGAIDRDARGVRDIRSSCALHRRREDGSTAVELVVLAPVFLLFVLVAVALGRYELARQEVAAAARSAVDAAAVAPTAASAVSAASSVAIPALSGHGIACGSVAVVTHIDNFVPGGSVSVSAACQTSFADLLVPGLSGSTVVQATQTAPIDPYRTSP